MQIKNNLWLLISMIILTVSAIIGWCVLNFIFCVRTPDGCSTIQGYTSTMIEIAIGIGISLIIHDHTRKIQKKENADLDLTIQDTYYHLWSLHETLCSYILSKEVRAEHSSSIQILSLLSQSQANLSKCGRKLNIETLSNLQLHLILIQKAVSVSIDPRGNIEEYWSKNSENVKKSFTNIKTIATSIFEPHIDSKHKMPWRDLK